MERETVILKRDCDAVMIPAGTKGFLPAGTEVVISQVLGGSYTVQFDGGLARIEGKDADALGKEVVAVAPASTGSTVSTEDLEKQVWAQLKTCYDPEIPVNIVDLGLVYDCHLSQMAPGSHKVEVKMTLTAPGCGMGPVLQQDVHNRVMNLEGVDEVVVDLVWDPQWNQGMMTEAARLQLGLM